MIAHVFIIIGLVTVMMLSTLLPFLPGGYDPLAAPLSAMAQTFGKVGLLLVPIGIFGFASRSSKRLAGKQRTFAIAVLVIGSVVWLIVALAGLSTATLTTSCSNPLRSVSVRGRSSCTTLGTSMAS